MNECHICGSTEGEIVECERCKEFYCESCAESNRDHGDY